LRKKDDAEKDGGYFCAVYNAPFETTNRRNEIWLAKEKVKSEEDDSDEGRAEKGRSTLKKMRERSGSSLKKLQERLG